MSVILTTCCSNKYTLTALISRFLENQTFTFFDTLFITRSILNKEENTATATVFYPPVRLFSILFYIIRFLDFAHQLKLIYAPSFFFTTTYNTSHI